jgi:hypothetical protein
MKGYWQWPEATKDVFVQGSWFRSGDAATVDEEGALVLVDTLPRNATGKILKARLRSQYGSAPARGTEETRRRTHLGRGSGPGPPYGILSMRLPTRFQAVPLRVVDDEPTTPSPTCTYSGWRFSQCIASRAMPTLVPCRSRVTGRRSSARRMRCRMVFRWVNNSSAVRDALYR